MVRALALLLCMAGLGCLHLLGDHYFIINYDSFYFHDKARLIWEGQGVGIVGSGLAYPVGYAGKVIGLDAASVIIGPLLGILTGLVLYWGVSLLYSPKVALLAVVCFVFAQIPRFVFLAGNLDRDGLHMLIMTLGILGLALFLKTQRRPYLALTLATIPLLYLEWGYVSLAQYIPALCGIILLSGLAASRYRDKWVLAGLGLAALLVWLLGRVVMKWWVFDGADIAELSPLSLPSLIQYATLAVPVWFGLKAMTKRDDPADRLAVSWLVVFLLMGFFSSRLSLYASVGACIIGGVGLQHMWHTRSIYRIVYVAGCVMFLALSWVVPENTKMPQDWHEALIWTRQNTPAEATIASWWSYGHWITDVGRRSPAASQGTGSDVEALADIYFAPSEAEARAIMQCYGWDYLVMSTREGNCLRSIRARASTPEPGAFYTQAMSAEFAPEVCSIVFRNATVLVITP